MRLRRVHAVGNIPTCGSRVCRERVSVKKNLKIRSTKIVITLTLSFRYFSPDAFCAARGGLDDYFYFLRSILSLRSLFQNWDVAGGEGSMRSPPKCHRQHFFEI